jgi:hypothetical protein
MSRWLAPLAVLGLCLASPAPSPLVAKETAKDGLRAYVVKKQGRHAYGVYIGANKIGWMIDDLKLGKYQGREVAVQTSELYTVVRVEGEKSVLREKSVKFFALEGDGPIIGAQEETLEDKTRTVRTVKRLKDRLVITTQTRKRTTERKVPLSRENLLQMQKLERWLQGNPAKGATFISYSASFDQDQIDIREVYTFVQKKSILWGGVKTEVFAVRVRSRGANFATDLRADGTILQGKFGGLFDLKAEKEAAAKKLSGKGVDFMAASSVPVDRSLGEAARVVALTLEASGLGDFKLPTCHRQRVRPGKNGTVVIRLTCDRRVKKAVPLTDKERAKYLQATVSVQAKEPAIQKLARKIIGKERNSLKIVRRLAKWVHRNLHQTNAANASTALDVLDNRAGDCTEHALLFVTLARAAGIPAREVGGLAYVGGKRPLFGWHAWAEIHDGSQWVTVDPTWDQVYVDATHIKFDEDPEDLSYVNVVGKLKLKVVKVSKKK